MFFAGLRRRFAAYSTRGLIVGGNFAVMIVLAKLLSPTDYGRVVYLWSIAVTFAAVGSLGVPAWLLRELSRRIDAGGAQRPLNANLVLMLVFVLPALVIAGCGGAFGLLHPLVTSSTAGVAFTREQILLVMLASWSINVLNNIVNFPRIMGNVSVPMAIRDAAPQCLLLVATGVALTADWVTIGNIYAVFAGLTLAFTAVTGLLCLKFQSQAFSGIDRSSPAERPDLLGFWGLSIVAILATNIDILIGGLFLSAADLGYYQLIKRVVNLASLPQIIVNWAVIVPVGRAFAGSDFGAIQLAVANASRLALWPLILLSAVVPIAAVLVSVELGYGFNAEGARMLSLLLLGAILNVLFGANFAVASQCQMEYQALSARLVAIALFCVAVFGLSRVWASGTMLAFCQLMLVLISNAWLWNAIWRKIRIDSSVASVMQKNIFRNVDDK